MAAEHLTLGLLNAVVVLSSSPSVVRPTFYLVDRNGSPLVSAVYRFFLQKDDIRPLAWVGQGRILLGGGRGHCPRG